MKMERKWNENGRKMELKRSATKQSNEKEQEEIIITKIYS